MRRQTLANIKRLLERHLDVIGTEYAESLFLADALKDVDYLISLEA